MLDHGRLVAEGTADELKRRIPGGHVRLRFADPRGLDVGRRASLGAGLPRRRRAHPAGAQRRQRPRRCGPCSTGSTTAAIEVDELTVHTPDLDDVFLALTGNPDNEKVTTR